MCAQLIRSIMDAAVASGLNVMRAWAHAVSPEYALQTSPGVFSEPIFRGLDYALDQARARGLKVRPYFSALGPWKRWNVALFYSLQAVHPQHLCMSHNRNTPSDAHGQTRGASFMGCCCQSRHGKLDESCRCHLPCNLPGM